MLTLRRAALAVLLVLFFDTRAHAQLIAYEGFDYPIPGGATFIVLDGATGGTAVGWDTGPPVLGANCTGFTGGHSGASWITSSMNVSHTVQNHVVPTGLTYPMLATRPGMALLVNGSTRGWNPSGGIRSFRTLDASASAAASVRTVTGRIGAGEVWISFLGGLDPSTSASTVSFNGGIHLFEQIGDINACPDGPKHPFEHLQFMDRNAVNVWTVARTTGGTAGAATFDTTVPFDHVVHFHVIRIRFDHAATCTMATPACPACPAANPNCNEEVTLFMDPNLALTGTPPDSSATVGPVNVMDFAFDTFEIGAEGEAIDLDEIRVGTTFDAVAPRAGTTGSDAGTTTTDAGADAGLDAATVLVDAGVDAAAVTTDASASDAASAADAASTDAARADAGTTGRDAASGASDAATTPSASAGCGCRASSRRAPVSALWLLVSAVFVRRRRAAR